MPLSIRFSLMFRILRISLIGITLVALISPSFSQSVPVSRQRPAISKNLLSDRLSFERVIEQVGVRVRSMQNIPASGKPVAVRSPGLKNMFSAKTTGKPLSTPSPGGVSCTDTTLHLLTTETGSWLGLDYLTKTRDGNILIAGFRYGQSAPYFTFPYLIKYTPQGNIVWAKSFDGLNIYPQNYADSYKCFELNDGSLLLAGDLAIPEPVNGREELALWKLDANGNLQWVQTDSSSIWTQYSGSLFIKDCVQDPAGNIYLGGDQYAFDAIPTHSFVLKMDPAGNVQWDKSYASRAARCYGIMFVGNELALIGSNTSGYIPDGNGNTTDYIWCMRVNPATGDSLSVKAWYPDYGPNAGWNAISSIGTAQLLDNGNIAVFGNTLSDLGNPVMPYVHAAVAEFDPSFNYLQGWMIASNIKSNFYNTVVTEHASGRISYTYLTYVSGYDEDILYGAIEHGQIIKERIVHQRNRSSAWTSNFLFFPGNEDIVGQYYGDPITNTSGQELVRLHDSDTSSLCGGHDTSASTILPYAMKRFTNYRWGSISSNTLRRTNRVMPAPVDDNPVQQTACKLVSFCDSVKLFLDKDTVCAGSPAIFTCRRNPECGSRPVWYFDTTNLQSYSIPNDSTLQVVYRDQYRGLVLSQMNGTCKSLSDSKMLTVLPGNRPVSLGGNAFLCPDSSLVLRPQKGYSSYTWQDGSTADSFLVNAPGKYYLTVTNTCGTPGSDTVLLQQAPSLNFSAGPDISMCLNATTTLQAPSGYNNYSWKDGTGGAIYNTQDIFINPPSGTQYFASAQTSLGCVVRDTVNVTVKVPIPVNLGNDSSLCSGDSVLLNAGNGFLSYTWNNGSSNASIYASRQGEYFVKVQSPNGCYSSDTMQIYRIYALPLVNLDAEHWLCEGSSRLLDAGNGFASYQWQDGSSAPTLSVNATGIYWVHVIDMNGCAGGDTATISQIVPVPANFLKADTLICSGYPSEIRAKGQFSLYNWSTGETKDYITIKTAGSYSLTVSDDHGCSATENISVSTKQCLFGIYFPNIFSPNKDGINEIFRPLVFGNLSQYHFQIFNRWGQLVFESSDYAKGWNGTLGGTEQPVGVYAWISRYQFEGEMEKKESGTLLLIR